MGKLKPIVAVAAIICSPAIAQEKDPTLEEFVQELQNHPSDSTIGYAEVYGTEPNNGPDFYVGAGAARTAFATPPAAETPCAFPPIYSYWVGPFWYVWCESPSSPNPDHEAKRDTYISFGGRPPKYRVSAHYDCQDSSDFAAMPPIVRAALCP